MYNHQPLPIAEIKEVRLTWDTTIFTDKRLKYNRTDITVALKETGLDSYRHCCASGPKYPILTEEKVERYQDQVLEESTDPRG